MEEKKEEVVEPVVEEKKNSKKGLIIVLAIVVCVVAVGIVLVLTGAFDKKEKHSPNSDNNPTENQTIDDNSSINNDDGKALVEELTTYVMETLFSHEKSDGNGNGKVVLDEEGKILNWEVITSKFTDNFVNTIKNDSDTYELLYFVEGVAYKHFGVISYELRGINDVEILSANDNAISAKVSAKILMGFTGGEDGNMVEGIEDKNIDISLIKESGIWKIDSFIIHLYN